jgi:hypothetical protein
MRDFLKSFTDNLLLFLKVAGGFLLCLLAGFVVFAVLYAAVLGFISLLGNDVAGLVVAFIFIMIVVSLGFSIADGVKKRRLQSKREN